MSTPVTRHKGEHACLVFPFLEICLTTYNVNKRCFHPRVNYLEIHSKRIDTLKYLCFPLVKGNWHGFTDVFCFVLATLFEL